MFVTNLSPMSVDMQSVGNVLGKCREKNANEMGICNAESMVLIGPSILLWCQKGVSFKAPVPGRHGSQRLGLRTVVISHFVDPDRTLGGPYWPGCRCQHRTLLSADVETAFCAQIPGETCKTPESDTSLHPSLSSWLFNGREFRRSSP